MNKEQVIRNLMAAAGSGDAARAGQLLTDDFQISGPFPEPLGKEQWLGMHVSMHKAFPDWSFNINRIEDEGDTATVHYHITGTHKGELDLSPMGMGKIGPSSKKINLPPEYAVATFHGEKISGLEVHGSEGGGLPGLLKQIGADGA